MRRSAREATSVHPERRVAGGDPRSRVERALRAELVDVCRRLSARDLVGAAEGNVSCRLPGGDAGELLVTPSGVRKGDLAPGDLVVVGLDGSVLRGGGRASTELGMHLAVYAARPDVQAVVHAHPLTAIAMTVAGVPPPNDLVPEASVVLGTVAVAAYATPGTDEVAASLAPLLAAPASHDVILLERHGAIALGATLSQALDRMETLERVARIALAARLFGRCEPLPAEAVAKVLAAAGVAR